MVSTFPIPACRKAAALLESASGAEPGSPVLLLCARCLLEAAEHNSLYTRAVRISYPFFTEAETKIKALADTDPENDEDLEGIAFALVECFAAMARENSLSKGTQQVLPAQAEVMRYFEESGEWTPDDGTLVSHYYYRLIPDGDIAA